jgi:REP element-mobilizing transposase RayT
MMGHAIDGAKRKWYHVVLRTHRRRALFKIPGVRRFCERELTQALTNAGWIVDAVRYAPTSVHVLVQPPLGRARADIVNELQQLATSVYRQGTVHTRRRLWDPRVWCATVSHGAGLAAVRRHLRGQVDDPVSIGASRAAARQ